METTRTWSRQCFAESGKPIRAGMKIAHLHSTGFVTSSRRRQARPYEGKKRVWIFQRRRGLPTSATEAANAFLKDPRRTARTRGLHSAGGQSRSAVSAHYPLALPAAGASEHRCGRAYRLADESLDLPELTESVDFGGSRVASRHAVNRYPLRPLGQGIGKVKPGSSCACPMLLPDGAPPFAVGGCSGGENGKLRQRAEAAGEELSPSSGGPAWRSSDAARALNLNVKTGRWCRVCMRWQRELGA